MSQKVQKKLRQQQINPGFDSRVARAMELVKSSPEAVAPLLAPYTGSLEQMANWMTLGLPFEGDDADNQKVRIYPFVHRILLMGFAVGMLLGKEQNSG